MNKPWTDKETKRNDLEKDQYSQYKINTDRFEQYFKKAKLDNNDWADYDKVWNSLIFKDLNLTKEEIRLKYGLINEIFQQEEICLKNAFTCPFNFRHLRLKRYLNIIQPYYATCVNKLEVLLENQLYKNILYIYLNHKYFTDIFHAYHLNKTTYLSSEMAKFFLQLKASNQNKTQEKSGFYIYSKNPIGKTNFFIGLIHNATKANKKVALISLVDWINWLIKSFKQTNDEANKYLNWIDHAINSCDYLFIDQLGEEWDTKAWFYTQYFLPMIQNQINKKKVFIASCLKLDEYGEFLLNNFSKANTNNFSLVNKIILCLLKAVNNNVYYWDKNDAISKDYTWYKQKIKSSK